MNDLTLTKRCQRKRRKNRTKKRNALWGQRYTEREKEREGERCILVDISAKRLDPADNLNLLRAPSRVSQPASLPALLHLPATFSSRLRLHPQVANNNQNMRSQLPPEERSKRVAIVPQMSSTGWGPGWCWCWGGGSRLMKASEIDGCVCWQHWNYHCASESLSQCVCVCCLFVPHCAATQIFCYRNGLKLGPVGLGPLKWLR